MGAVPTSPRRRRALEDVDETKDGEDEETPDGWIERPDARKFKRKRLVVSGQQVTIGRTHDEPVASERMLAAVSAVVHPQQHGEAVVDGQLLELALVVEVHACGRIGELHRFQPAAYDPAERAGVVLVELLQPNGLGEVRWDHDGLHHERSLLNHMTHAWREGSYPRQAARSLHLELVAGRRWPIRYFYLARLVRACTWWKLQHHKIKLQVEFRNRKSAAQPSVVNFTICRLLTMCHK